MWESVSPALVVDGVDIAKSQSLDSIKSLSSEISKSKSVENIKGIHKQLQQGIKI